MDTPALPSSFCSLHPSAGMDGLLGWLQQPRIAKEILHSMRLSEDIRGLVKGLMIESYLVDGAQKPVGGVYGQSITDPCLGWEKTERMIYELAELL